MIRVMSLVVVRSRHTERFGRRSSAEDIDCITAQQQASELFEKYTQHDFDCHSGFMVDDRVEIT